MTVKKVLIFGLPRSGTTVLQKRLGKSFGITGYSEPFSSYEYRTAIGDPYEWVANLDSGIIKILSQNLDYINVKQFVTAGNFDSVIVTQRRNLTDLCISLYYAEQVVQQYHYDKQPENIEPFTCPLEFVNAVLVPYRWYQDALAELNNNSISYTTFDYDAYQVGNSQTIAGVEFCLANESSYKLDTVSANIPYADLCVNYNEIKTIINQTLNENNS